MLRIAALAAFAAALTLAAPACAEDSIHISTAGKTPEQIHAEVRKAANRLCRDEARDELYAVYVQSSCVAATTRAALNQSGDPALMKMAAR